MANKRKFVLVRLVPEKEDGLKDGVFYVVKKNPRMEGGYNNTGKLRLRKYNKRTRRYEWFIEKKISK